MEDRKCLLDFGKSLARADRLKIVGILAQRPSRPAEIIKKLSLPPGEGIEHLESLEHAGLVHTKDGFFELDTNRLEALAPQQCKRWRPGCHPDGEPQADRIKILVTYLNPDGTIRQIPSSRTQAGRFGVILEYLHAAFEMGVNYTEKEVNTIIRRFNEDVAGLRRDLVDAGLLARERDGSRYWRPD